MLIPYGGVAKPVLHEGAARPSQLLHYGVQGSPTLWSAIVIIIPM